jgi:uncharacterized membrane protein YgaE (UPF0421/DUF939 family)
MLAMGEARVVVKISAAAGVAWWIGNLAGQPRPVFAAIVPVLVIRSDTTATFHGSLGRVVGVLAGVGLGLAALEVIAPTAIAVGVVMAIALALDRGLRSIPRLSLDTRNQTAVSALLMMFGINGTTLYAGTRAWETAVGSAVALGADALDNWITSRGHGGAAAADPRAVGMSTEAT